MNTVLERPRPAPVRVVPLIPSRARVAVSTLLFLNGTLIGTWVSRIPAIHAALRLSDGVFGLALLAMALGALLAMPLAGWCAERFGSQRVCQLTVLAYAGLLPLLAWAPNVVVLVLALFCFGAAHGGLDVAMNAQAVAVEKQYRRAIMSSFHALFSLGGLTSSLVGGLLAARGVPPWLHFFLTGAVCAVAGARTFPHLLKEKGTGVGPGRPAPAPPTRRPELVLPGPALVALGAVAFCSMMGEGAMADWSAIFLRSVLHASEGFAAVGYAAFSVTMAATRFFGDRITARLGPVALVRLGGAAALVGMGIVLVNPSPFVSLLGFAGVGAGLATVVPMTFSAAGRVPGTSPSIALATVTTLGYLGFLIGPPIIGFAAEAVGLRAALGLLVFTSALIILLASRVGVGRDRRTTTTGSASPSAQPSRRRLAERAVAQG